MLMKDAAKERLLAVWRQLSVEDRHAVEQFAHFLLQKENAPRIPDVLEPVQIEPSEGETAIKALKRLKKTYPMIEADTALLDGASGIILKRVMGMEDAEAIILLEKMFQECYQDWKKN
ncbi:MAG: hypothetical protein H7832_13515 [Magnetococcus sp. DMHC-6]